MANKGLKGYTKQLFQSAGGVIEGSVNLNQEDSNLHLIIPVMKTHGLVPFEISLIYNLQNKDETGLFGRGFKVNYNEKLTNTGEGYRIDNADRSADLYELNEGKYINLEAMSELSLENKKRFFV